MRKFEKVTFDEFKKYFNEDKVLYDSYKIPVRKTKNSAGYDFFAISDVLIKPKEIKKIPTGIKAQLPFSEMLMIVVRSSMGFKYNIRLCNQVGIIDSDYYNNIDNEGHIFVAIQNEGDKEVLIKKNDSFVQGIFVKYGIINNEEDINESRKGGIGSTSIKEV